MINFDFDKVELIPPVRWHEIKSEYTKLDPVKRPGREFLAQLLGAYKNCRACKDECRSKISELYLVRLVTVGVY